MATSSLGNAVNYFKVLLFRQSDKKAHQNYKADFGFPRVRSPARGDTFWHNTLCAIWKTNPHREPGEDFWLLFLGMCLSF